MGLETLGVTNFRCFEALALNCGKTCNLIVGENASGKTSLLEALFFLGRGRSFRAARSESVVREGAEELKVFGRIAGPGGQALGVGWSKGGLLVRVRGEPAGLAELAEALPMLVIDARSHLLIEGGPGERRRYLDWGVFHVEHRFLPAWRRYRRALVQRNSLLKRGGRDSEFVAWERELAEAGEALDAGRRAYLHDLVPLAEKQVRSVAALEGLELGYRAGWPGGEALADVLAAGRARDRQMGATQQGPHRADIPLRVDGMPASQRVSRGQQKVLAGALILAQAEILEARTGRRAIILCDDLAAELDVEHRRRFLAQLAGLGTQVFLSAVDAQTLISAGLEPERMFHVERAQVREMI